MKKNIYIPPNKLKKIKNEIKFEEKYNLEHQQHLWGLLKRSLNGIVNKINEENINFILIELINENLIIGKGLLVKSIIKAQRYSSDFSYIFSALINVLGSKLPELSELIIKRVIILFRNGYENKDRLLIKSSLKFIANMINQKFLNDFIGLQILALFLENYSNDSIELSIYFLKECGKTINELSPKGIFVIYEKLRELAHEKDINKKSEFYIEEAFNLRKNNFLNENLKTIEILNYEDLVIHNIGIDEELDGELNLDEFEFKNNYEEIENEWEQIKSSLIDDGYLDYLKQFNYENINNEVEENYELDENEFKILSKTIYLTIKNSIDFEECAHKLMMMKVNNIIKKEMNNMIVDCCSNENSYVKFYGLLSERFCNIDEEHKENFTNIFYEKYITIHKIKTNDIRNWSKLYAYLLSTNSLEFEIFKIIVLTEEETTSSSRIFIKNLFQDLAELVGINKLYNMIYDENNLKYFENIFPKLPLENLKFSINFFILIGLEGLITPLKENLKELEEKENIKEYIRLKKELEELEKLEKEDNFLNELDSIEKRIRKRSYSNSD